MGKNVGRIYLGIEVLKRVENERRAVILASPVELEHAWVGDPADLKGMMIGERVKVRGEQKKTPAIRIKFYFSTMQYTHMHPGCQPGLHAVDGVLEYETIPRGRGAKPVPSGEEEVRCGLAIADTLIVTADNVVEEGEEVSVLRGLEKKFGARGGGRDGNGDLVALEMRDKALWIGGSGDVLIEDLLGYLGVDALCVDEEAVLEYRVMRVKDVMGDVGHCGSKQVWVEKVEGGRVVRVVAEKPPLFILLSISIVRPVSFVPSCLNRRSSFVLSQSSFVSIIARSVLIPSRPSRLNRRLSHHQLPTVAIRSLATSQELSSFGVTSTKTKEDDVRALSTTTILRAFSCHAIFRVSSRVAEQNILTPIPHHLGMYLHSFQCLRLIHHASRDKGERVQTVRQ
ncbi:hypothetical protein BC938DRAFT_481051 [Jimgerdemannia flammicorona]|uniref:Uncharacterized protein n=1 Tax=Jimgerdemannia flammicorona TaxID=994334 RepID=A0A433QH31_9FUNG|nr:hypothetical protein BC938DRAFT_481051 [Jimgerdemannia flammicorona]